MVYLFVDSNIYIGSGYVFANDFFSSIEKYSLAGEVKLLICSICQNEVKTHIKKDVEETVKVANQTIKKGIFYAIRSDARYSDRYLVIDENQAQDSLVSGFEGYLRKIDAELFPIEGISIEELMEDYYHMNPPFEPKKPKEFKDAIMIKALKMYQEELGTEIHVLSNDEGFRNAFLGNESFVVYEYHKKFLQFLVRREEVCCAFEKYCQENKGDEISDIICDYIANCEFYNFDKCEFEMLDTVEINDIDIEFLYCEIVDKYNVKIHISVDVDVNVNARYLDEESSYYDQEEMEYIFRTYMDVIEKHNVKLEVVLDGKYVMNELEEQDIIEKYRCLISAVNDEETDSYIELGELTFKELILCEEYIPAKDKLWYETNSIYCSECGKRIGFGGEECYFTCDDDPLCDGCMEDNAHGFVCPNCSRKCPESMRGGSGMFCIDCEQQLDV